MSDCKTDGERRLVWDRQRDAFVDEHEAAKAKTPARFIKGPLPLEWMQAAARMPGRTLQVALVLWYLVGLKRSDTVRLSSEQLDAVGVSRDAKYDALQRLSATGLVTVEQRPGRAPVVTVVRSYK
ncbi:MAG: hypothetical protein KGZ72_10955 [Roseovarius sp.]|jgi:hypothetical protein|nr:hypothetical protein [Roseovarius sp.]